MRFTPFALSALLLACDNSAAPPPAVASNPAPSTRETADRAPSPPSPGSAPPAALSAPPPAASRAAVPAPPEPAAPAEPDLLDEHGEVLPQTEAQPATDSALFQHHAALLFEAIARDDPDHALSAFFPIEAYSVVKAITKPELDWKRRLVAAFRRDIHRFHRKVGADATFVGIDVPEGRARWMKPHSEGNRVGYWRVLRSTLRYEDAAGTAKSLTITSMISWRGEWYVVHLDGFK